MNTAVAHPQDNGLIERDNKSLMHGLKARLGRERVGWVDELPNILWAHRTMLKTSNGETPLSLTYGSEAVIPAEIGMPTYRTVQWNEALNEEEMRLNLDLIQERRKTTVIREAKYKKENGTVLQQASLRKVSTMSITPISETATKYVAWPIIQRWKNEPLKGAGAGLVLIDLTGTEYTYAIRLNFASTNDEAEYEALLAGLQIAGKMKVPALKVKVDSKLVACQMNVEFIASNDGMAKYLMKAKELSAGFKEFSIENVPQNQNQKADVVSKLALVAFNHLTKEILVEVLNAKSVEVQEVKAIVEEEGNNWMTPIIKCIDEGLAGRQE
nr:reverse transcriptase domain-containing protein [Tanacetum cinerariifolium]